MYGLLEFFISIKYKQQSSLDSIFTLGTGLFMLALQVSCHSVRGCTCMLSILILTVSFSLYFVLWACAIILKNYLFGFSGFFGANLGSIAHCVKCGHLGADIIPPPPWLGPCVNIRFLLGLQSVACIDPLSMYCNSWVFLMVSYFCRGFFPRWIWEVYQWIMIVCALCTRPSISENIIIGYDAGSPAASALRPGVYLGWFFLVV